MSRNKKSGMSRRRFLGAVGAGAAGLAGAGMLGSGLASAASPPAGSYKIGVLRPTTGWSLGAFSTDLVFDYAVERINTEDPSVQFEVQKADCTCGDNAVPGFVFLKEAGCDFIIGPACSGSTKTMMTPPAPDSALSGHILPYPAELPSEEDRRTFIGSWSVNDLDKYIGYWDSTSMLSYSADNYAINELMTQNMRAIVDMRGPLRYRTFGVSALDKTDPLGSYIALQSHSNVVLVTEDEVYVKGLADGVKQGLGYEPAEVFAENTFDGYKAAINSAYVDYSADALVFNVFTEDNVELLESALESWASDNGYSPGSLPFVLYGGPAFTNDGHLAIAQGMVSETALGILNPAKWADYGMDECMEYAYIESFGEGYEAGRIYCAQTVEAVRVMTRLIKEKSGSVSKVNMALETESFDTFFGDALNWSGKAFPSGMDTQYYFYDIDADGNAVPKTVTLP
jgi:ABC-type branched-subunit amino acid transport system substrate-binding protein